MTIKSVWLYLEADPPIRFAEGTVIVARPDDWGQFNFTLPVGKVWSVGEYRVELHVDDELLAETRFRVSGRETPDRGRRDAPLRPRQEGHHDPDDESFFRATRPPPPVITRP